MENLILKVSVELDVQRIYDEADADIDLYEEEEMEEGELKENYYPMCVERAIDYYIEEYNYDGDYAKSELVENNYVKVKETILNKLYEKRGK